MEREERHVGAHEKTPDVAVFPAFGGLTEMFAMLSQLAAPPTAKQWGVWIANHLAEAINTRIKTPLGVRMAEALLGFSEDRPYLHVKPMACSDADGFDSHVLVWVDGNGGEVELPAAGTRAMVINAKLLTWM
jgi:hypothetical protein